MCTILLYAEGYKAEATLQHYRTIQSLPLILGGNRKRSPFAGIDSLFPSLEAWERFRRDQAYRTAVKGLTRLGSNKFPVELQGRAAKEFFESSSPDPGEDIQKRFNQDLETSLGETKRRFLAYAYSLCEAFLSKEAGDQKRRCCRRT